MASKKYTLTALLVFAAITGGFAQLGGIHNYQDSSKIAPKSMAQQNEWMNNSPTQPFPAKPRNQWQLGVFGGVASIFGDLNASSMGWNAGISARKALGYTISVRPSIAYGKITGLDYRGNNNNLRHMPRSIRPLYQTPAVGNRYAHYHQTELITPSLDFLISLNNIMFHRKESKVNVYALVGYSPMSYLTGLELLNESGGAHNISGIDFTAKRKDIKERLRELMPDPDFETPAVVRGRENNFDDSEAGTRQWVHSINAGAGIELKLGKAMSISGEFKYTMPWNDDYIDGWFLESNQVLTPEPDNLFFANLSLNFNLGANKGRRVAPLWHLNPLGYVYSELNNPSHMKFPKPVLDDSDNDGVADQFDLEPNTPAGCPVDTRGRSRDTDGDGVPDCRDKELITPTICQPVDADGVGKCPDPECCKNIVAPPPACNIGSLPSVQFASGRAAVTSSGQAILDAAASQIKANPACKICVVGYGGASKREQQLSWDRVNAVINYLVERQGIGRDRFVFKYGEMGDPNTVDMQDCSGEEGPNAVPAPHPQYRKTN